MMDGRGKLTPGSEWDWAGLIAQLPQSVIVCDLSGQVVYLNRAARQAGGVDDHRPATSVALTELFPPEFVRRLLREAMPAAERGEVWQGRFRASDRAGNDAADWHVHVFPFAGGASRRAAIMAFTPPSCEEWAEALAEARARKRSILESSLDPIISINHEGLIIEFNRAAEQTFGYPRDRILGTRPAELLFPPDLAADQQQRIDRYLAAGEGSMLGKRAEVVARRADGRTFPAELTMAISREGGEPVLTFFIRDISQAKSDAAEKARHAAELERSNYDLQQFAYVASHDLQEPLRKIKAFADRLRDHCCGRLDEIGEQCLTRIQSAAVRMQTLIDGLLTLSRVATDGREFTPVNLEQIVREVVSDLESQIEKVQGRVEVERLPTIQADPVQMRQLFQNLIGNALKFHRPDEPPLVRVSGRYLHRRGDRPAGGRAEEESARILVEDNGIGFDEKDAERIFGVFQRLHTRDAFEGTGMGLAICRRIVERHGGTITAHSKPGAGSTFEVILPVVPPAAKRSAASSSLPPGGGEEDIVY